MSLVVVTAPTIEPVTLEEARLHLRLDADGSPPAHPDDTLIEGFIAAAREWAEHFTGRSLAYTGYELRLAQFPAGDLVLPRGPIQMVDAITYVDAAGERVLLDDALYIVDEDLLEPAVRPVYETVWPAARGAPGDVVVSYIAGYSAAGESAALYPLPASIRAAILLMVGHLYENREDSTAQPLQHIPLGVTSLLRPYRVRLGMA